MEVPGGAGVLWAVQLVPSNRSARVWVVDPPLVPDPPIAVHAFGAVHETPYNSATVAPDGVGLGAIAQLEPFHSSASVLFG